MCASPWVQGENQANSAAREHSIPDPELSQLGREQCKQLRESLSQQFGDVNDAVAVVSPMRRTIETALLSLGWLAERGIPIQADALWQGMHFDCPLLESLQPGAEPSDQI